MMLNLLTFYPALVLLFFPADAILSKRLKLRAYEHLNFDQGGWARVPSAWWLPSLWLDPIRAFLGAWLLVQSWNMESGNIGLLRWVPLLTTGLLLALSVGIQLHTRRDEDAVLAPIGYLAGIWFALLSPAVALLAVVVGVCGVIAFRSWAAFFFCGGCYAGVAGLWLMGKDMTVPLSAALAVLPWLVSAISGRTLMQPLRSIGYERPVPIREIDFRGESARSVKIESRGQTVDG